MAPLAPTHPLLLLLRAWPGPKGQLHHGLLGVDEEELVSAAIRHGLAGLVRRILEEGGITLSGPAGERLKSASLQAAASSLRVRALLFRALEALAAEGVAPIVLKGYPLAARLYPDPLLRATSDVDLLVVPKQLPAAERALLCLGLSPRPEVDHFYPVQYRHHRTLQGSPGTVELHFRPLVAYGIPWEAEPLLAHAVEASLEGKAVRYLRPEDELCYLALHAANHMLQRLAWLLDLKLLALRHRLDWQEVGRVARSTGMPELAFYALEASSRAVGAPIPEELLRELSPGWPRAALAQRFFSERNLVDATLVEEKRLWALAKLLLAPRYRTIALFSLRRVLHPAPPE